MWINESLFPLKVWRNDIVHYPREPMMDWGEAKVIIGFLRGKWWPSTSVNYFSPWEWIYHSSTLKEVKMPHIKFTTRTHKLKWWNVGITDFWYNMMQKCTIHINLLNSNFFLIFFIAFLERITLQLPFKLCILHILLLGICSWIYIFYIQP